MSVDELASYLTELIKTKDLFHNHMGSHKNAWAAILVDLLRVDGAYDGEGWDYIILIWIFTKY